MVNRGLYKIERFHTLDTPESERLKVTALNLLHPTASPLFQKVGLFLLRHSLQRMRVGGGSICVLNLNIISLRLKGPR